MTNTARDIWRMTMMTPVRQKVGPFCLGGRAQARKRRVPAEMVRAILTNQPLTRNYRANWRF